MLKNIRLHIEDDEQKQALLDDELAQHILTTQHKNINAFQRNIPSLLPLVKDSNLTTHSPFNNKFGEYNIVDFGIGRTLYGFHPKQEVHKQVEAFLAHAPNIDLDKASLGEQEDKAADIHPSTSLSATEGWKKFNQYQPAPNEIDCLVILGCGLAIHILELIKNRKIKYLLIYEPELQYFQCSTLLTSWDEIFELAKANNTQLFIQTEKDGRDLINDLKELKAHFTIDGFFLYQHYNHPVFDSLCHELTSRSWTDIERNGIHFSFNKGYNDYVPIWTPTIDINHSQDVQTNSPLLEKNLSALKKYFPAIYKEFKAYEPKVWLPIQNNNGEINLVKKDSLKAWYGDSPVQDCLLNFENFSQQPNKDGLVLGYSGTKLAHYVHYQFVKETEQLLEEAAEEVGNLPEEIASIIIFGIGVGYQVEAMLKKHKVEKLFLCEPNTDFFYASLFAIDWQFIFETLDKSKARIYFNIGDDGTNLFRDLLNQFHSIGPYILNNTYFYQSYYNASLNNAIAQLREQLQIVISMGEYFDHAYFGIEHTKEGFRRNYPVLTKKPASKLSYDDKEVPVFIVGNGPSLDLSIQAIKESREQVIIVSCGTALQALHRHGITPDFHAEIEQNRSSFDWATLIGDLDYLKHITLISCNGIHPDTGSLYKDVLIAFKEGESSTVSSLNILGKNHFEVLQHAFPTVSNFVTNIVSVIGFRHIYLMGVDLGFIDVKHHHSKSSGYYKEDGEETFDYTIKNNTSLIVPGNFRAKVNTKHEFKISRQIIEKVTYQKPKDQTFYNCSDGARIAGTSPLPIENLLIVSTAEQKRIALDKVLHSAFSTEFNQDFIANYETTYSHSLLLKEIGAFEKLLDRKITTRAQATQVINKQKEMLFASYKNGHSLLFYYLYGTVNYASAVMTKLSNCIGENQSDNDPLNSAAVMWINTLKKVSSICASVEANFDNSNYDRSAREHNLLKQESRGKTVLVLTNSNAFAASMLWLWEKHYASGFTLKIDSSLEGNHTAFDYVIYNFDESLDCQESWRDLTNNSRLPHLGKINTLLIVHGKNDLADLENQASSDEYSTLPIPSPNNSLKELNSPVVIANISMKVALMNEHAKIIIPKYAHIKSDLDSYSFFKFYDENKFVAYDLGHYIGLFAKNITKHDINTQSGTRPTKLNKGNIATCLCMNSISQETFARDLKNHNEKVPEIQNDSVFRGQILKARLLQPSNS